MSDNTKQKNNIHLSLVRTIVLALLFLVVFLYGVGVGMYHLPPYSLLAGRLKSPDAFPEMNQQIDPDLQGETYKLTTYRSSYFALDDNGALALQNSLPYEDEGIYVFERTITPERTAILIMDPWVDMATNEWNEFYGAITEARIIPLVELAIARGHPIIVLTNDPDLVSYNTKIHPELQKLVTEGKISLLFHSDFDEDSFAEYLHSNGINTLIYTGFASNICVIGRRDGMIAMRNQGFRLFFIPGASAAVEFADSWDDQRIHEETTGIISQWIAEIIDYDEIMRILKASN
jgi:nicotinamidase-related amidase